MKGGASLRRTSTEKSCWPWSRQRDISSTRSLQPLVLRAAEASYAAYAREAVEQRRDDPRPRRVIFSGPAWHSWNSTPRNGPTPQRYAQRAIDLAHWMIDVHRTLDRPFNTAYAYEGIISAYYLAQSVGDAACPRHSFAVSSRPGWQSSRRGRSAARTPMRTCVAIRIYHASCTGGILSADRQSLAENRHDATPNARGDPGTKVRVANCGERRALNGLGQP